MQTQAAMQLRAWRQPAGQQRARAPVSAAACLRRLQVQQRPLGRVAAPQLRRLSAVCVRALPQEKFDSDKQEYVVNSEDIEVRRQGDALGACARSA